MQRYGLGSDNTLPLEENGDYTREVGYLKFADFTSNVTDGSSFDNQLNNIWYQPEEIFPVDGTPEVRQHALWVPVDPKYYQIAQKLKVGGPKWMGPGGTIEAKKNLFLSQYLNRILFINLFILKMTFIYHGCSENICDDKSQESFL